ncbi:MAG: DUF2062 domain-containing protein [Gallionellaceae bacterium]
MRKLFRKHLPSQESIRKSQWARPFGAWLHHPNLWNLHRRSVAGGVAIGMFAGLIPGPLQMIGAAMLAVLFRVNLPVAVFTTLYSNPLTILPLYLVAYEYGAFVIGYPDRIATNRLAVPEMDWSNWTTVLAEWFVALGKPFAVGLPLLATTLAIVSYFAVRLLWRWRVVWEWRRRAARRSGCKGGMT